MIYKFNPETKLPRKMLEKILDTYLECLEYVKWISGGHIDDGDVYDDAYRFASREIRRKHDVFGLQIAAEYALALLGSYPLRFHYDTKTSIEYNNPFHHYSDAVFGASDAASRWFWRNKILLTDDR